MAGLGHSLTSKMRVCVSTCTHGCQPPILRQLKFYCKSENTTDYQCGVLKWGGLKYKLKYFKIHTPSEHTFDNVKNGMEIQFVMVSGGFMVNLEII